MKRKLVVAATMAACVPAAMAQSSVTLYGIVDLGVSFDKNGAGGKSTQLKNGFNSGSRFGFRGTEDLGGGLQAIFNLEAAIAGDTGALSNYAGQPGSTTTSTGFNRRSVVGLQSRSWGLLTLGRDYTPFFQSSLDSDAFNLGLYGSNLNLIVLNGSNAENLHRASNGIFYTSPSFSGFTVRAFGSLGAERSAAPKDERRMIGGGLEYRQGPILITSGYQTDNVLNAAGTDTLKRKDAIIGGTYDFGAFSLSTGYASVDPAGPSNKRSSVWFGGTVNVGSAGKVIAQVSEMRFQAPGVEDGKGRTYGVAYSYQFSKQTNGFITWGRVNNNARSNLTLYGAAATVAAGGFGADPSGLGIGIRKRF
jgi:predicted porin